jgi:hypothetical protein
LRLASTLRCGSGRGRVGLRFAKESHVERSRMMKVICPVEGKNKKTFWMRVGSAFPNKDGSMNIYLNAYPTNGKLQIRELDESDLQPRGHRGADAGGLDAQTAPLDLGVRPRFDEMPGRDELPF